ncbi:hypothetical protein [Sulfuriroseicoccus oceanibius]|uniref:Terminase small subunit n=1 Tax=Sulfuriroseicoccus oceanibius TaxID=2707525 RepID=A0A6B3LC33_9BACT|nr:hypothetical protein [Sulfuriroseicoccus oceanibius]QQL44837.1 hypothetical protein G3M56_013310 [Sulfuriroseicoccus oceanibius]
MPQPPRPNAKQSHWCRLVAAGHSDIAAYEIAYGASKVAATRNAARMRRIPHVLSHLEALNAQADSDAVMTLHERKKWLTRAILTPLAELGDDSDLVTEMTTETTNGETQRCRVKKVDPLRAMAELNRIDGAYAPTQIHQRTEHAIGALDDEQAEVLRDYVEGIRAVVRASVEE